LSVFPFRAVLLLNPQRMTDDATLLRRYVAERSGEAFAELVRRHLPLVYSAAARRLGGDTHRAQDVAQLVFCALARHAPRLCTHPALTGWLYTATRNEVLNILRAERRRRIRETEAHMIQETLRETDAPADWSQLGSVLDTAMDRLNARDREAVLLRFFQGRPFAEVGTLIGLSEDAARKRVERALDKLRNYLRPHGIASTSGALAAVLAHQSSAAVPAALATHIAGTAFAAGATATTAGIFVLTKLQATAAAVALLGGAAGLFTQRQTISELRQSQVATQQQLSRLTAENATLAQNHTSKAAELDRLATENARLAERHASAAAELSRLRHPPVPAAPVSSRAPASPASAAPNSTARRPTSINYVTGDRRDSSGGTPVHRPSRADIQRRYGPFLDRYHLTPAQRERFVDLRFALDEAREDVQEAMRKTGAAGGTPEIEALRNRLTRPLWNELFQVIGPDARAAYNDYERSSGLRLTYLEPLLPAFAAATAPLAPEQVDALTSLLAANIKTYLAHPTDVSHTGLPDWDAIVAQADTILSPAQLAILDKHAARQPRPPAHR